MDNILALDIGEKRIGVAVAGAVAKLPHPHGVIGSEGAVESIKSLIEEESIGTVIIGLPRGLDGQDTKQTHLVRQFANGLAREIRIPVHLQDEALTSHQAEAELRSRKKNFQKGDIDALAATIILHDYLQEHL